MKIDLQPKLTLAKCRRNVENFLDACRRIGVDHVSARCAICELSVVMVCAMLILTTCAM